jgi:hypothetical protein
VARSGEVLFATTHGRDLAEAAVIGESSSVVNSR